MASSCSPSMYSLQAYSAATRPGSSCRRRTDSAGSSGCPGWAPAGRCPCSRCCSPATVPARRHAGECPAGSRGSWPSCRCVLARVLGEHAGHRDRGGSAAGTDLGEVDDVPLAQLRVGLAGVAVQREMIGTGGLADHEHQQRFLLSLQRSRCPWRRPGRSARPPGALDHQALLGVLAHRVDEVGPLMKWSACLPRGRSGRRWNSRLPPRRSAGSRAASGSCSAGRGRTAGSVPARARSAAKAGHRATADSRAVSADQVAGLGGVGLEDVLHHHRVDADAVAAHEAGRAGRAQGDQGQAPA